MQHSAEAVVKDGTGGDVDVRGCCMEGTKNKSADPTTTQKLNQVRFQVVTDSFFTTKCGL